MSFSSGKNLQNNVNTTEAQTLSNKTMDSTTVIQSGADIQTPAIIDPSRADVKKDTLSNLQTYAASASNGQLCYSTDSKKMFQVLDGALAEVGGGAGGINYITNPDAEVNADGWNDYANTTPGVLPDDFGGTVSGSWNNIVATSSGALRGSKSFAFGGINSGVGDLQGHGVYSSFTVDSADLAKKMTISFDYLLDDSALTNAVDGMLRVYIYDEDKSELIRVNGEDLQLNANAGTHYAQFQTDSVSTNYRLVVHNALALNIGEDFTIRMDNVQVGPTAIAHGTIVTDWEEYDIEITATTTNPTLGTHTKQAQWRRVGDSMEVSFTISQTTIGTDGSGNYTFKIPSEYTIDESKLWTNPTFGFATVGTAHVYDNSVGELVGVARYSEDDQGIIMQVVDQNSSNSIQSGFSGFASNALVRYTAAFSVPIQGWSSNAKMSEDFGGREVAARYTTNDNTQSFSAATETTVVYEDLDQDTTASYNTSTGVYTIPESGLYSINASLQTSTTSWAANDYLELYIDINSGTKYIKNSFRVPTTASYSAGTKVDGSVYLEKGDTVEIVVFPQRTTSVNTTGDYSNFSIAKLASPQTILETETVAARYTSNAGTNISPSTYQILKYEDIDYDTHGSYDTSTGIYDITNSGKYTISAKAMLSGLNADQGEMSLAIYVNGVKIDENYNYIGRGSLESRQVVTTLELDKGDELTIRLYQTNGAGRVQFNQSSYNSFSIARIK